MYRVKYHDQLYEVFGFRRINGETWLDIGVFYVRAENVEIVPACWREII